MNRELVTIAVHLHVFYFDLIPQVKESLVNIPQKFDLFASVPEILSYNEASVRNDLLSIPNVGDIFIEKVPNRGRDLAPMLCTFKEKLCQYDVLLHIHTKKSPHDKDLEGWFPYICRHILPSKYTSDILRMLADNVGMISPPDYVSDPAYNGWGDGNIEIAQQLIERSSLNVDLKKDYPFVDYPHGSMFWARMDFLKPLFDMSFSYEDFPMEPIGVDGTTAHALERLFFVWGNGSGKEIYKVYFTEEEYLCQQRYDRLHESLVITQQKNKKHLKQVRILIYLSCLLGVIAVVLLLVMLL